MDNARDLNPDAQSLEDPADEHPQGEEIRRQVEYYFSDENLPNDSHMLGLCGGEQNLPVSINQICGFKKMRQYKGKALVKASLSKSTFLEVVEPKHIRRRVPLAMKPTVKPEIIQGLVPRGKPWLTKGMLKPTGFEASFADAPVTPGESQVERDLYDISISFETRIETAIQRYQARRKFHQSTAQVFNAFLEFGGIEAGPKQFTGRLSEKEMEDKSAAEVAAMNATHFVSRDALDGTKWLVDFVAVAKGFLSTERLYTQGDLSDEGISIFTKVLSNFYRYLLHHDVCPEYDTAINEALQVCDVAARELPLTIKAGERMPDSFSSACSVLHGGNFAGVFGSDEGWDGATNIGWSENEAKAILRAGIEAHGTPHTIEAVKEKETFTTGFSEDVEIKVLAVELPDEKTRAFYEETRRVKPCLRPLGKLHYRKVRGRGKRWQPRDQVIWVEEDVLHYCFEGMTIEANMRELDIGVQWIDSITSVNGSFYVPLANDFYKKNQDSGLPKEYLKRMRKISEERQQDFQALEKEAEGMEDAIAGGDAHDATTEPMDPAGPQAEAGAEQNIMRTVQQTAEAA